ncbi:hypothetical protein D3C80_1012240 [compost metagenome]
MAQFAQQRLQPLPGRFIEIALAIDPVEQALSPQFCQALIELATKPAELFIAGIPQGQHRIRQAGAALRMLAVQATPECRAAVRRVTVAKGAGDQQQAGRVVQLLQGHVFHTAQLHRQADLAQALGTLLGQGLTVAGLRGPEQQVFVLHRNGLMIDLGGVDTFASDPAQGHRAILEGRLQRQRIDRVAGQRIDRQVFTVDVVPVERRKAVSRQYPGGDPCRQYGLPAA